MEQEQQLINPTVSQEKIDKWAQKASLLVAYKHPEKEDIPTALAPYCPTPLPKPHERLTDAMFLALPAIQELQNKLYVSGGDSIYYVKRCSQAIYALTGCYKSTLHNSVLYQDFALTRFLLEHDADSNEKNWQGETPIFMAENEYVAKLLVVYGAQLYPNLLHNAMRCGYSPELVAWYIKKGFDVNAKRCDFFVSPLHSLWCWRDIKSYHQKDMLAKCEMLLDAGAKLDIKNRDGYTFIDLLTKTVQERDTSEKTQQKCDALIALATRHPNHPNNCIIQKQ